MKKITILTIVLFSLIFGQLHAQDGYTYTLVDNGGYSFSIAAVPNASSSNFATSVQSYGFTIIVPDGVTASITSSLGGAANATFFNGNDIAQPTIDGYLITETLGSPASLPAPSAATNSPMVTIQVNGSPTSGIMYILENNSAIASAITPLKSFMQADMVDDGMATYTNRVNPSASAVTDPSAFDFATMSTLTVEENELVDFSMYPNPASDIVQLKSPVGIENTKVEIFDILGKQIKVNLSEENTIDVSKLPSGAYFVSITADDTKVTKKLIIK